MDGPWGRFDDLRAGTAQRFGPVQREVVARRPEDVVAALEEVDRATSAGQWAFGFVAYEVCTALDPTMAAGDGVEGLPLVWFGLTSAPLDVPVIAAGDGGAVEAGPWEPAWDASRHRKGVEAVRELIAAGEVYQCNLTTRLTGPVTGDPIALYRDLALAQRGAHNAYLDLGRFVVASASPELFVEWRDDALLMRPMKGTARRGRTLAEDDEVLARLTSSAKERAENVMIVDVVRNDLARIARTGSVAVPALCRPERYETVHQLTSDVTAQLRHGVGLAGIFGALFPCASVTGAPKPRSTEVIRDLEDAPRGVYCGAVGVVAPPGAPVRARFSVAIRTVLIDRQSGEGTFTGSYGTGGGITWSSDAEAEHAELLDKARVLRARPQDFHLLETMRHESPAGVRSLAAHLGRMAASAEYFDYAFDPDAARRVLGQRLQGAGDARVRLLCSRDGTLSVEVGELPPVLQRPVVLALDEEPMDTGECWPFHKTTLREPYTSRRLRHPDADDVVLVNSRGEVTEASTANLAARIGGTWWTPPLASGCLPGVERGRLLAAGELQERVLRPADLHAARELALVNSLRGWRPAVLGEAALAADDGTRRRYSR